MIKKMVANAWLQILVWATSSVPLILMAEGPQSIKGYLDGIPMHELALETRDHARVGVRIDGAVDEAIW